MNAPIRDAFDCSSRKPIRRHFASGFPRALLSLSQEKSSGVEIEIATGCNCAIVFAHLMYDVIQNGAEIVDGRRKNLKVTLELQGTRDYELRSPFVKQISVS